MRHAAGLARDAARVLLRLSAYDYALAGTLTGQRAYVVAPERYAAAVRESAAAISRFTAAALAATVDAAGPLRERVVVLADGLIDIARDANAYADGGDPAAFARVVAGVSRGWTVLRELTETVTLPDEDVEAIVARGSSFVVDPRTERVHALTVGPFASAAEAEAAATRIGTVERVTKASPFVVRVGTYLDRAKADAAVLAVAARGLTGIVTDEQRYTFARSGPAPDAELWREPERVFDTWGNARRVAVSPNAAWVATGSDDGVLAIFTGDGTLRSLPRYNAGVAHLAFSDDGRWLMGGGVSMVNFILPPGVGVGVPVRLPSPATGLVYIPTANAFAATAKGPTGEPAGGPGMIAGRAPDGAPLAAPFPLTTPAAGAALAATAGGELYIATSTGDGTDVEVLRVGRERFPRGVVRVPGQVRVLAIDRGGTLGAVVTDQGVFRFGPRDTDPGRTVKKIAEPVRDLAFGHDGTLYLLEKERLSAHDVSGDRLWSAALIDGRRLVIAARVLVLDGPDRVVAFTGSPAGEDLGVGGNVQDLAASPDGKRVAALVEGRRAVIFKLP